MAVEHYESIQYTYPITITEIQLITEETVSSLTINGQNIDYENCKYITYQQKFSPDNYKLKYVATINNNQQYGPVKISLLTPITKIILDDQNHENLDYDFNISISKFRIKNYGFNPDIIGPDHQHKWLIYLQNTVLEPTLKVFVGCRETKSSDKILILRNDAKFFYVAYDINNNMITDTGIHNPVYLTYTMLFNIDESTNEDINYNFSNYVIEDAKLIVNNCDPLKTLKYCNLSYCYKALLYPDADRTKDPVSFIHDSCPNIQDRLNKVGMAYGVVLKRGTYSFQITNDRGVYDTISVYIDIHKTILIQDIVSANINWDFIINDGKLPIASVRSTPEEPFKITLERYCGAKCHNSLTVMSWDNLQNFIDDESQMLLGFYKLTITFGKFHMTVYQDSFYVCKDNTIQINLYLKDPQNFLPCDVALPNFNAIDLNPDGTIKNKYVRSDGELKFSPYMWYEVKTTVSGPSKLLELFYEKDNRDCGTRQLKFKWDESTYYTVSASIMGEHEYFVEAKIDWYGKDNVLKKSVTGPVASTLNDKEVYAVIIPPANYVSNSDYVVLSIWRVNDPYNNLPIHADEEFGIGRINFYAGNKTIFKSPCDIETDGCYFLFNGMPSYYYGINVDPMVEQLLSKIDVETFSNHTFDGTEYGKATYRSTTIKIPCTIPIQKNVRTVEDQIEIIYREYLTNLRDSNNLLKYQYLQLSYSDRIYKGFLSGVQEIKFDESKMEAQFTLEFEVPSGLYYEEFENIYGIGDYKQFNYNQQLKPLINIDHNKGPMNIKITEKLTNKTMIIAGFDPGYRGRLVIDCANKKIFFGRYDEVFLEKLSNLHDITKFIPFIINWLVLPSHYDIEVTSTTNDIFLGVFGGELVNTNS
jgi:hypothetical protein